jgi:hypothetical protein
MVPSCPDLAILATTGALKSTYPACNGISIVYSSELAEILALITSTYFML